MRIQQKGQEFLQQIQWAHWSHKSSTAASLQFHCQSPKNQMRLLICLILHLRGFHVHRGTQIYYMLFCIRKLVDHRMTKPIEPQGNDWALCRLVWYLSWQDLQNWLVNNQLSCPSKSSLWAWDQEKRKSCNNISAKYTVFCANVIVLPFWLAFMIWHIIWTTWSKL